MIFKSTKKYLPYLFSYLLIYPISFPIFIILWLATGGSDMSWKIFSIIVTIVGSLVLNNIFIKKMKFNRNTKQTWMIFFAHLILIPSTSLLGYWFMIIYLYLAFK